jgi:chromosomal replication initiator protein
VEKKKSVPTVASIWHEVLGELRARRAGVNTGAPSMIDSGDRAGAVPASAFAEPWMGMVRVAAEDTTTVTLAVANAFALGRVQKNLLGALQNVLRDKYGLGLRIELRVDPELFTKPADPEQDVHDVSSGCRTMDRAARLGLPSKSLAAEPVTASDLAPTGAIRAARAPTAAPRIPGPALDEDGPGMFGLESFVVGRRHRMTYSAVLRVVKRPGSLFNPLVIHGTPGVGKTHLLRGTYLELRRKRPDLRVRLLDGERFLSHFVFHVKNDGMSKFRQRYRELDVLILDDLQLLADKIKTQEEFLHTFDALVHSGAQVVVSCPRLPEQIPGLIGPLVSRLNSGLVVPLHAPDYDARLEILRRHDRVLGGNLGDEALGCVADSVRGSVRELLGALKLLTAHAGECDGPRDRAWSTGILRDLVDQSFRRTTPDQIIARVAQYYRLSVPAILSERRDRVTSLARHLAVYLCREFTHCSLNELRRVFNRDSSTLRSADKKVRRALSAGDDLASTVQEIVEGLLPES